MLINLHGRYRRDIKWGQQDHQIPHAPAFRIGGFDVLQLIRGDSSNLQQSLRLVFQHTQCVGTEAVYDQCGSLFTDAFDQPGGKITVYALFGLRHDLLALIDLQLNTVFSVLPFAVQDHAHLIGLRQFIPDGDKPDHIVPVTVSTPCLLRYALVGGLHADNAILIARIIEDRPVISPDIPHGSPLLSRFLSVHRFSSAPSFLPFMPPRQICALHRSGGFPIPSHNPHKYRDAVLSAVSDFPCRCRAFS